MSKKASFATNAKSSLRNHHRSPSHKEADEHRVEIHKMNDSINLNSSVVQRNTSTYFNRYLANETGSKTKGVYSQMKYKEHQIENQKFGQNLMKDVVISHGINIKAKVKEKK